MPKKTEFADLELEWKDAVADSSPEEIRQRIADITLDQLKLKRAKKSDKALAEAKAKADKLAEKYKDGSALNNLKLKLFPTEKLTPLLKGEVADLALAEVELKRLKDDDQDLQNALDDVKTANETYSSAAKGAKLRIAYCLQVLKDKGAA